VSRTGLATAALVMLLASAFLPRVLREMPDFEVYWQAGHRALAHEPLYRSEDGHYQNKYLPVFALAAAPLALLPLRTAKIVWFYATVLAILGLVALSLALLPDGRRGAGALAALTFLAMLKFYAREVNLGQTNAVMGLLVLAGVWCQKRDRPALAGALFAASVAVKPYTVALLPYLLVKRQRLAFSTFMALVAGLLILPATIYGVGGNADLLLRWARATSESTAPNLLNPDNVSIWAMYARWIGPGPAAVGLALATMAALTAIFAAVVRQGSRVPAPDGLEVALLLVLLPLFSPQGWDYGLLLATPAVMLLMNGFLDLPLAVRAGGAVAVGVMALSVYDLMGREAYAAFMATSAVTLCALGLVLSVAVLRLRAMA